MNTHETYVNLETAKLLKQAGFDWEVESIYSGDTLCENSIGWGSFPVDANSTPHKDVFSAPSLAITQRWLREVMDTYIIPQISDYEANGCIWEYDYRINIHNINPLRSLYKYKSYEEALEAGIQKALKYILKDKEDGRNTNS